MDNFRDPRVAAIIGMPGCGKTTKEEELIKQWIQHNPKGLIYGFVPDPRSVLKKYVQIPIEKYNTNWALELAGVSNSLFVLDDYVGLMMSEKGKQQYVPTPGMTDLFMAARYSNNEIIYSCHGPGAVIPQLAQYTTHYFIYKTSVDEGSFDKRMAGCAKLEKSAKMVNAYCEMIGNKGYHPNDQRYTGQDFPYIVVDGLSFIAKPKNMKRDMFKRFIVKKEND